MCVAIDQFEIENFGKPFYRLRQVAHADFDPACPHGILFPSKVNLPFQTFRSQNIVRYCACFIQRVYFLSPSRFLKFRSSGCTGFIHQRRHRGCCTHGERVSAKTSVSTSGTVHPRSESISSDFTMIKMTFKGIAETHGSEKVKSGSRSAYDSH